MEAFKRYKKFILITLVIIFLVALVFWKTQRMIQQLEIDSPVGLKMVEDMKGIVVHELIN